MSTTTTAPAELTADALKDQIWDTALELHDELDREPHGRLADEFRTIDDEYGAYLDSVAHDDDLLDVDTLLRYLDRFRNNLVDWMAYTTPDEEAEEARYRQLELAGHTRI